MAISSHEKSARIWSTSTASFEGWPKRGIAIEGDFAGIQNYVLKPVPGAKGAGKRLRGRSLQVVAFTRLISDRTTAQFPGNRLVYSAGGRFLIVAPSCEDWAQRLRLLRTEIERWAFGQFRGDVVFHLAGVEFDGEKLPREKLHPAMQRCRFSPLAGVLTEAGKWREDLFRQAPGPAPFKCPACLNTASEGRAQPDEEDDKICLECESDKRLGSRLAGFKRPGLSRTQTGGFEFMGTRYDLSEAGEKSLDLVHHLPVQRGQPLTLEDIAKVGRGREWLGYLRVDADRVGQAFRETLGDPVEVRALSACLNQFFSGRVQQMISQTFPWIYPVYGGGDDLFVIGPWDQILTFALQLHQHFGVATQNRLGISAGVSLSKPKQHILSKSEEAEHALVLAKKERASIHALGTTMSWDAFSKVLPHAKRAADWHDAKLLPTAFIQDVLGLHRKWVESSGDWASYRPLLHYQIERNLTGDRLSAVRTWALGLMEPENWKYAGFVGRYVVLSNQRSDGMNTEVQHGR